MRWVGHADVGRTRRSCLESRFRVDFSQKDDDKGEPVPCQPVADAGFVAHEQGFEAVEPRVGVFDHDAAAVEFGVEKSVVIGLPVGGAAVAGGCWLRCPAGHIPTEITGYQRLYLRL